MQFLSLPLDHSANLRAWLNVLHSQRAIERAFGPAACQDEQAIARLQAGSRRGAARPHLDNLDSGLLIRSFLAHLQAPLGRGRQDGWRWPLALGQPGYQALQQVARLVNRPGREGALRPVNFVG